MDLKLDKPICFFDLETTGVNVSNDRIVEISVVKINIDKTKVKSIDINLSLKVIDDCIDLG